VAIVIGITYLIFSFGRVGVDEIEKERMREVKG
jgi:hypothetical protein